MSAQFSGTLEVRLLALERALNRVGLRLEADERRLAGLEQQAAQLWASRGFGGGGSGGTSPAVVGGGGISAASGGTPGSGSVTIQLLDTSGPSLSDGQTVTCYSIFAAAVSGGAAIMVGRDGVGNYWLLAEDCE